MESPIKMARVGAEDKENIEALIESDEVAVPIKGIPVQEEIPEPATDATVATTTKEEEAIEPILQENAQRFVLFPIKYHEVSFWRYPPLLRVTTRKVSAWTTR